MSLLSKIHAFQSQFNKTTGERPSVEFLNQYYGMLEAYCGQASFAVVLLALTLGYFGAPLFLWALLIVGYLFITGYPLWLVGAALGAFVLFLIPPLRQIISSVIMKIMKGVLPNISDTERTALEAGVVWCEGELFSGNPDINKLMDQPYPKLSADEQAFMDGPVEEVCKLMDDWKIWKTRKISEEVFELLKKGKFFGMIVPKEYGGLGFSALANSAVIGKLSSRSVCASITVMVPNSLGPAELLIHYGTQAQKDRYLSKLANGQEIPCFGLTEPGAGSDAGSLTSSATLFKGDDGKIYMKLNWQKRWITLAAISTVIGLAFRLYDPENLLGKGEDLGITCALIPSSNEGVVIGRRHDPLGVPFYNCPTEGKDVVVNAEDAIIGGLDGAGKGWSMLMDCLGAGRGISLPAQCTGGAKFAARVVSNHAVLRKQFGISIGKFEGVEEPMARIAGSAYYLEAMRMYTLSALDQGISPPVVTAIAKYNATEDFRKIVNDSMDIMGGAGISMGPKNLIAIPYIACPIGITVEGANILTRTLMIFGQGALRAHPYAFKEVDAVEKGDLKAFDKAFWGHIGHIVRNLCRSIVLSTTHGLLAGRGGFSGKAGRYVQKLKWASASFAIMSDLAMGILGGKLKFKEKLTGRYADILSQMYIATAVLRKFKADGEREEDLPYLEYSMDLCFSKIQKAFDGIFDNFIPPFKLIKVWSNYNSLATEPSDAITHKLSKLIQTDSEQRDRITAGIFYPTNESDQLWRQEKAFKLVSEASAIEKKIKKAVGNKTLPKKRVKDLVDLAVEKGVITASEKETIAESIKWRWDTIQVDDFSAEEFVSRS